MGSASGIELGPASCVLVSARPGAGGAEVSAVRVVDPAEWPASETALIELLRSTRKAQRLPRRTRVVAWALEKPVRPSDPVARAIAKPLVAAGFRIDAVLTPAQALAAVAATRKRPNEGPIAWLAINMHGAAIAIVHGGQILYSRTLGWRYNSAAQSVKEQLLQRYNFVTHIGPELKHGIDRVRKQHGAKVETVVTCGDLPDLRSLTMPLIEELDLEVETLDSADGLLPRGDVPADRLTELAPAIRVACAAAVARVPRSVRLVPAFITTVVLLALTALAATFILKPPPVLPVDARVKNQDPLPASPSPIQQPAPATPPAAQQQLPVQQVTPSPAPAPAVIEKPTTPTVAAPSTAAPTSTGRAAAPEKKEGPPLPPVPPVTSILTDNGRRLAMVGGTIVGVGDRVGPRVVVRIDDTSVVLREPSGREITVLLRPGGADAVKSVPFAERGRR